MGKTNSHKKIFLNKTSVIAVFLAAIICFTSPSIAYPADDYKLSAQDAGIMAGVAVGIGIIIGHIMRAKKTDGIKSTPTDTNKTGEQTYFIHEHQKKEDFFSVHPIELHITVLAFKF